MALIDSLAGFVALSARLLNPLQALVALGTRVWVSWQFLKSGWVKIGGLGFSGWENTLYLFENEYRVPLLPPYVAAVTGTFGEFFFPALLILGLAGRIGAVGLFFVNVMAVVSYAHVLLSEGFEAAVAQHYLWGFMLLVLAVYGPGQLSADHLLARRRGQANVSTASTAAY
jgi:putative oxidoreductase